MMQNKLTLHISCLYEVVQRGHVTHCGHVPSVVHSHQVPEVNACCLAHTGLLCTKSSSTWSHT